MFEWLQGPAKKTLKAAVVGTGLLIISGAASAQQSMTIEQLEDFILKKKAELNEAVEQRDDTLDKRAEVEQKRAEQAERQQAIQDEMRALCEERETVEPGTLDDCLAELDIASN